MMIATCPLVAFGVLSGLFLLRKVWPFLGIKTDCQGLCPLDDDTYVRRPSHFVWSDIRQQVITERELKAKSFSLDQWFQTVDGAIDREKAQRVSALGVKWRKKATNPRIEFRNKLIKEGLIGGSEIIMTEIIPSESEEESQSKDSDDEPSQPESIQSIDKRLKLQLKKQSLIGRNSIYRPPSLSSLESFPDPGTPEHPELSETDQNLVKKLVSKKNR